MPKKALRQQLTELHGALGSTQELDTELRVLLKEVSGDIEKLLGEDSADDDASAADQLQARIRREAVDFEAEHPRLARILGDLADTLAKLGI